MFPPQGSPTFSRRQLRALLALTFLVWATQTMLSQMVHAQEAADFAAPAAPMSRPVELELRGEATVLGREIRLAQIVRWADADADVMGPLADLIVSRFDDRVSIRRLTLDDIKKLLTEAGVNTAPLNFSGPIGCTVNRSDTTFEPGAALKQFEEAVEPAPARMPTTRQTPPAAQADAPQIAGVDESLKSLRQLLVAALADKTGLPADALQVSFRKEDENVLKLVQPHFDFRIEPQRAASLGDVSWNVTISPAGHDADGGAGDKQRVFIKAEARAWQDQVVLARPLSAKQLIADADLQERHVLVDKLPDSPPIARGQLVGRQAARELRPGVVMTEKLVDIATLVRPGQIVTVTLARGGIAVTTVARAIDAGALGQSVRVKNESTKEIFRVQVTGPQEAAMTQP